MLSSVRLFRKEYRAELTLILLSTTLLTSLTVFLLTKEYKTTDILRYLDRGIISELGLLNVTLRDVLILHKAGNTTSPTIAKTELSYNAV